MTKEKNSTSEQTSHNEKSDPEFLKNLSPEVASEAKNIAEGIINPATQEDTSSDKSMKFTKSSSTTIGMAEGGTPIKDFADNLFNHLKLAKDEISKNAKLLSKSINDTLIEPAKEKVTNVWNNDIDPKRRVKNYADMFRPDKDAPDKFGKYRKPIMGALSFAGASCITLC